MVKAKLHKLKARSHKSQMVSRVQIFATPWTVAHQAPLFMGFSGQEYRWCGLPFPSPEDLLFLTQGSNPCLLHCRQILYHLSHQGSPLWASRPKSNQHHSESKDTSEGWKELYECSCPPHIDPYPDYYFLENRDSFELSGNLDECKFYEMQILIAVLGWGLRVCISTSFPDMLLGPDHTPYVNHASQRPFLAYCPHLTDEKREVKRRTHRPRASE